MNAFHNLLKVIFWLSTIVAATDCCYSQILPRLNQNLLFIVQQKSEDIDNTMIDVSTKTTITTTATTTRIINLAEEESMLKFQRQQQEKQKQQHQLQNVQQEEQQENSDSTYFFQIEIDKYLQHVKDFINSIAINPNKTKTGSDAVNINNRNNNNNNDHNYNFTQSMTVTIYNKHNNIIQLPTDINTTTIFKTITTLPLDKSATATTINFTGVTTKSTDTANTKSIRITSKDKHNDKNDKNMKYDFLELYTFMSDTLSTSCSGEYASQYCLNNGQCFVHLVGLFYCKCAEGYMGERCEAKYIYTRSDEYHSGSSSSTNSIIRVVKDKKPKILSARFIIPFRVFICLTILYLSLSLLWSYKSQCTKTHITTQSSRHLIY